MDRSEILANFQACTGIDDIGECIQRLDATDWVLEEAVSGALSQETLPTVQNHTAMEGLEVAGTNNFPMGSLGDEINYPPPSEFKPFEDASMYMPTRDGASSSVDPPKSRMINFHIRLGDSVRKIELDDTATLDVFNDVASIELGVPRSDLRFDGWPNDSLTNKPLCTTFSSLNLPDIVELTVRVEGDKQIRDLTKEFVFKIKDETHNKLHEIKVVGSQLISDIKQQVEIKTKIVSSRQVWSGLNVSDTHCTVASLHPDVPVHVCAVRETATTINDYSDDEDSDDEFVEASEDNSIYFIDDNSLPTFTQRPLMPEQANDDILATNQFQEEFQNRFGPCPQFHMGSLESASESAFAVSAQDRKLLAIYLHHDKSIQSNVFCSQILCQPSVVEYLLSNCIVWGWDVTEEFNRAKFLTICKRLLGKGTADTITKIRKDEFPALIIVEGRGRSAKVTSSIVQGHETVDELMSKLIRAVEDAEVQRAEDLAVERESRARESIKREQEEAYQQSLLQDMEKQRLAEQQEAEQSRIAENLRKEEEERKRRIEQIAASLPAEPTSECKEEVSRLQLRPPDGSSVIKRRFLAHQPLKVLLMFVESKGFSLEQYRLLSSWPKRDVSSLDENKSLKDHKLFPQETLIIEEKH